MNYKYTIIETHSNKNADDHSSVLLHDAPVKLVRYENGDVLLTVESIIVLPNREPNETNRYLSTGETEIRIANTTLPDGFPMGEVDFDLNTLEYNPKYQPHIFRLSAFFPDHSRAVWFDFPCDSVTYSFDEFTGDSQIQKAVTPKEMPSPVRLRRDTAAHGGFSKECTRKNGTNIWI